MLISELMKTKKNLIQLDHSVLTKNSLLNGHGKTNSVDDDDEEERFYDVMSDDDEKEEEEETKKKLDEKENLNDGKRKKQEPKGKNGAKEEKTKAKDGSWVHKRNVIFKRHDHYDTNQRSPLYAGADMTLTYELLYLTKHYHPTVVVFATKIMKVIYI